MCFCACHKERIGCTYTHCLCVSPEAGMCPIQNHCGPCLPFSGPLLSLFTSCFFTFSSSPFLICRYLFLFLVLILDFRPWDRKRVFVILCILCVCVCDVFHLWHRLHHSGLHFNQIHCKRETRTHIFEKKLHLRLIFKRYKQNIHNQYILGVSSSTLIQLWGKC